MTLQVILANKHKCTETARLFGGRCPVHTVEMVYVIAHQDLVIIRLAIGLQYVDIGFGRTSAAVTFHFDKIGLWHLWLRIRLSSIGYIWWRRRKIQSSRGSNTGHLSRLIWCKAPASIHFFSWFWRIGPLVMLLVISFHVVVIVERIHSLHRLGRRTWMMVVLHRMMISLMRVICWWWPQ